MRYVSTRSDAPPLSFEETVFAGLAPDGGLYVPVNIPVVTANMLKSWSKLSFQQLALELFSLYIDPKEISRKELSLLINESFSSLEGGVSEFDKSGFSHPAVTPVRLIDADRDLWLLELFHGPTLAFKDVALQFVGNLFEYFLSRKSQPETITVIGATSGDTGSAAIYGLKGKENIQVVILHPKERVSFIQERQMTTVLDENIHNIAIEGTFDDCQDIVKALFRDEPFRKRYRLAAINSINWARILAQITYYFYAFFRVQDYHNSVSGAGEKPAGGSITKAASKARPSLNNNDRNPWRKVQFSVPTGNFGNVLAGYYARSMGLPIATLVIGTNINDVLYRFFSTGVYSKSSLLIPTLTPAMDIQISSNFERLLYHTACEGNFNRLSKYFKQFTETGSFTLESGALARAREGFRGFRVDEDLVIDCIQKYYFRFDNNVISNSSVSGSSGSVSNTSSSGSTDAYGAAVLAVSAATNTSTAPSNTTFRMPVPLDPERAVTSKVGPVLLDPHTAVGVIAAESFIYQQQTHPIDEIQLDLREIENVALRQDLLEAASLNATVTGNPSSKFQSMDASVPTISTICIATAHPFKFPEAICNSINPFALIQSAHSDIPSTNIAAIKKLNEVKRRGHTVVSILGGMFYTMLTMIISPIFQVSSRVKYPPSYRFTNAQLQTIEDFYEKCRMLPATWKGLYKRPIRCATLPNSAQSVKMFIQQLSEIGLYSGSPQVSSSSLMSRL